MKRKFPPRLPARLVRRRVAFNDAEYLDDEEQDDTAEKPLRLPHANSQNPWWASIKLKGARRVRKFGTLLGPAKLIRHYSRNARERPTQD